MRDVVYCHCNMCRIQGAIASVGVKRVNFRIVRGDTLKSFDSSPKAKRWFCGECGSSIYYDPALPRDYVAVWAGTLDQPTGLRSSGHIFVADKPDYYEITDGLPEFDGPEHLTSLLPANYFEEVG